MYVKRDRGLRPPTRHFAYLYLSFLFSLPQDLLTKVHTTIGHKRSGRDLLGFAKSLRIWRLDNDRTKERIKSDRDGR